MLRSTRWLLLGAVVLGLGLLVSSCQKGPPGVTDKEIKIGHTNPYSGPASAYGSIGRTLAAYFKMVNEQGGINGRKINFITYDDGYSPPKTVEQVRRLVEQDEVLLCFNTLGTPTNTAIQKYLNDKKVPQMFVATGATKWNDPKGNPWTMGWQPNYQTESRIYAKYVLDNVKNPKIGILFQNDDYGKDYLKGFKDGLGDKANMIVSEQSYEVTDPTVDSQMVNLKNAKANVFFNITTPKFAAQAIKKAAEIGWKPLHLLNNVSANIGTVMAPAGFKNDQGIISSAYLKDPNDPTWANDQALKDWQAFMAKYNASENVNDGGTVYAYVVAQGLVKALQLAGNNLTRENVMKQAASLKDFEPAMLLPGIKVNTGPDDFAPLQQLQLEKFQGQKWTLFGKLLGT